MATALALVEQALEQGRSVVIVDRNGDLCGLADPARFPALPDDVNTPRAQRLLRDADVSLLTPGASPGRSVWLPLVPPGLEQLPTQQRSMVAHFLAESLGSLMGYHGSEAEKSRLVLLAKAIEDSVAQERSVELALLTERIGDQDPALVNAVGELNARQFEKLHDNLTALSWSHGELLEAAGARLEAADMIGPHPRPRVTILHVGQLGDATRMEYWVTRLLVEIAVHTASNETDDLHTLLFVDEADLWLPAEAVPATKEPLVRLLWPGRRDGLGVVLWSDRPGDLDYQPRENIGTWVLGGIAEGDLPGCEPCYPRRGTQRPGCCASVVETSTFCGRVSCPNSGPSRPSCHLIATRTKNCSCSPASHVAESTTHDRGALVTVARVARAPGGGQARSRHELARGGNWQRPDGCARHPR